MDKPKKSRPRGQRHLTDEQIQARAHRQKIGGAWDFIGPLQLEFLRSRGLEPHHKLLDVGCGALRGGVNYVRYLETGNYYGIDIEPSLIKGGRWELEQEGLLEKRPNLLVNDSFEVSRFDATFDYAVAVSLFTHLDMNLIVRCLTEIGRTLDPDGKFYASFFPAPSPAHLEPIAHGRGNPSYYDRDPYHYSLAEISYLASLSGVAAEYLGDWGHPSQHMLSFSPA